MIQEITSSEVMTERKLIKIIYLATPLIAVNAFNKLMNFNDIKMLSVVTACDKPACRGHKLMPSVMKIAANNNCINVFQTDSISKDRALIEKLKALEPDFFITFAFGQILSQEVIDIPKIATINLHASLLPKYRGANPIQRAILNGESITGITTMITSLGLDEGDICLQEKIKIDENMNLNDLSVIISERSPFILYRTIKGLYNNTLIPYKQPEDDICYAKKCKKEDAIIDFNELTWNIHNKVRGLFYYPGAYFIFKSKKIKLIKTSLTRGMLNSAKPGTIISIMKNGILVSTLDGAILLETVKPEGKSEMTAFDWSNGMRLKVGDIL